MTPSTFTTVFLAAVATSMINHGRSASTHHEDVSADLPDAPQTLEIGVIDKFEQQAGGHGYETVDRIVKDFLLFTISST